CVCCAHVLPAGNLILAPPATILSQSRKPPPCHACLLHLRYSSYLARAFAMRVAAVTATRSVRRRRYLTQTSSWLLGLLVVLGLLPCAASSDEAPAKATDARRPNIVLIVSDDQGYADLGCLEGSQIITPNLDRLAREGTRLTSFYVSWPACTPLRGSILTG